MSVSQDKTIYLKCEYSLHGEENNSCLCHTLKILVIFNKLDKKAKTTTDFEYKYQGKFE